MKKRILQIATTTLQYDGLSEVLLDLCDHVDFEKCDIEVVLGKGAIPDFIEKLNVRCIKYYQVPDRELDVFHYLIALKQIIKDGKYDIVHVHGNSATMALDLAVAKRYGVKERIAHGHNDATSHPFIHKTLRRILNIVTTDPVACSASAGRFLFGNRKVTVIPNCINVEQFRYNETIRKQVRTDLGLSDKYVVGHVGRLRYQKNHEFIIHVFNEFAVKHSEAVLLLVGEGRLLSQLQEQVKQLGIEDKVIFYGTSANVNELLQGMDLFLFPSRFEGFGITVLEAQASGLPCVVSDVVPGDVKVTDNLEVISLQKSSHEWCDVLERYYEKSIDRCSGATLVKHAGYDISRLDDIVNHVWKLENEN